MKPLIHKSLEDEIKSSFRVKKRLFMGLISATTVILSLILIILWLIPYIGLRNISNIAPYLFGGVIALTILTLPWVTLSLVLHIWLARPVLGSQKARGIAIKLFLPVMMLVGKAIGIPRQNVQASFILVNNQLIRTNKKKYEPKDVLLLMPHCIQNSKCAYRLTYDVRNCRQCGKCSIAGLIDFSDKYGIHLAVATGGTIARRIVINLKPKFIIAVACERDLASGIQDTYPLPVYGVLNERPHGPCLDTTIALSHVEWVLKDFLNFPVEMSKLEDKKTANVD